MRCLPSCVLLPFVCALSAIACDTPAPAADKPDNLPPPVEMCPDTEPGRKLVFFGQVLDARGRPISKAAVMAYNTGIDGLYVPPGSNTRIARIRGVAVTDDNGFYCFKTVWPGGYPGRPDPEHIHVSVLAPGHHVGSFAVMFKTDPRLTSKYEREQGAIIVDPQQQGEGTFQFRADLRMEEN